VGNRAAGDRLVHQVGVERAMVAAANVAFSPFTPLLFQGEEWGASSPFCFFADFADPEPRGRAAGGARVRGFEWAGCPIRCRWRRSLDRDSSGGARPSTAPAAARVASRPALLRRTWPEL
jgi:hypothetical protein